MNPILSAIYYVPNLFLFYETHADDSHVVYNDSEVENIIQKNGEEIYSPTTTKYMNKTLIKKTERLIIWNGINGTWGEHFSLYASLLVMREHIKGLKFERSNYIFEFLSSAFSTSYINRTKGNFGLYWKVDLFDNYAGYHNFNNKCTRGLLGLYIGVYHNYFTNKNIQLGYHIGIGMCIQRYYALCLSNRVIGWNNMDKTKIKNKYYFKEATEKEAKEGNPYEGAGLIWNGKIVPNESENFYLSEIFTNPFSYYNADLIVDLGILNIVHKRGFVININLKVGIVNTVLILRSTEKGIMGKIVTFLHNASIGFGYDLRG